MKKNYFFEMGLSAIEFNRLQKKLTEVQPDGTQLMTYTKFWNIKSGRTIPNGCDCFTIKSALETVRREIEADIKTVTGRVLDEREDMHTL